MVVQPNSCSFYQALYTSCVLHKCVTARCIWTKGLLLPWELMHRRVFKLIIQGSETELFVKRDILVALHANEITPANGFAELHCCSLALRCQVSNKWSGVKCISFIYFLCPTLWLPCCVYLPGILLVESKFIFQDLLTKTLKADLVQQTSTVSVLL